MSERSAIPGREEESRFDWPVCHEAENHLLRHIDAFLLRNAFAGDLARRMREETGTLVLDWIDSLSLPADSEAELRGLGFIPDPLGKTPADGRRAFHHPESVLPRVVLDGAQHPHFPEMAIHPESLVEFMAAHGVTSPIEGDPLTGFRRALVSEENGTRFHAVERRGSRSFVPEPAQPGECSALLKACELWQLRPRHFEEASRGYEVSLALIHELIALVGVDLACHAVFAGERSYWQRRNRAAQIQKARQDKLGLGWGNHDHHTFRSSRPQFVNLMRVMDLLGFHRRERYYAGAQAGWGAQILEQPVEGIVVFCDVDLMPEETEIDFSRELLAPAPRLGTVGLWCGLHGESFLDAGMHHLEARFDHALCREQLAAAGINTMKPFSDFEFLKQAFTEGERWPVSHSRAQNLLAQGLIDERQFQTFTTEGAIGSHLENLQRTGGFKGFNQQSVSAIIEAVDPRRQAGH